MPGHCSLLTGTPQFKVPGPQLAPPWSWAGTKKGASYISDEADRRPGGNCRRPVSNKGICNKTQLNVPCQEAILSQARPLSLNPRCSEAGTLESKGRAVEDLPSSLPRRVPCTWASEHISVQFCSVYTVSTLQQWEKVVPYAGVRCMSPQSRAMDVFKQSPFLCCGIVREHGDGTEIPPYSTGVFLFLAP